ncbi:MAG: phage holin family protein [Leeuwenhoekiella sp.]
MKLLLKLVLTALAVLLLAHLLPGIYVDSFITSLVVAIVLALLRLIVKPILIIFTLPITILTFGLFLLFINAFVIIMAGYFVEGFNVNGFWSALIFSLLLSLFQSILFSLIKEE